MEHAAQTEAKTAGMSWDEIITRQRALAESSIGDDRAYEFECLAVMGANRDIVGAALAKAQGDAA